MLEEPGIGFAGDELGWRSTLTAGLCWCDPVDLGAGQAAVSTATASERVGAWATTLASIGS